MTATPPRLLLTELPCPDCAAPFRLDPSAGTAYCDSGACPPGPRYEVELLLEEAGIDHNPAGWPRPCWNGIPIPWVVTVTEHGPQFRSVDDRRLAACQLDMLCQVCGISADPPVAVVIVDRDGCCLTPAPIHRRDCAALARTRCRAAAAGIMIDFDPERLQCVADSHLTLQAGFAEQWYFPRPSVAAPYNFSSRPSGRSSYEFI